MVTVHKTGVARVRIIPGDHLPPHAHIDTAQGGVCVDLIRLDQGKPRGVANDMEGAKRMKRVEWPFGPKQIQSVEALENWSVKVTWANTTISKISLRSWIVDSMEELDTPELFFKAHVNDFGTTIVWIEDKIEIDSIHLQLLESEQKGMPLLPDALVRWRTKHKLSQAAAAKALGISLRQWQNYESGNTFLPWTVALACKGWEAAKEEAA